MVESAIEVKIDAAAEEAVLLYSFAARNLLINQFSLRSNMEKVDQDYMREADMTEDQWRNRVASRVGDKQKMQNITVPIIMPQVEAALSYMQNVFLTGYPIFGVVADPQNSTSAMQMQAVIAENAITARWKRELTMFFRDGLKYNLHGIECEWLTKKVWTAETDVGYKNSAKPKETLWNGNSLKRMDLYNTFFDPRVHPSEIHSEGEFAGYIEVMSRVRMKKFMNDLYGKINPRQIVRALESTPGNNMSSPSGGPFSYYVPSINPFPLSNRKSAQGMDWLAWVQATPQTKTGIKYSNVYEVTKLYARIIPADFGFRVPAENTPQVWKFIIINGTVVLCAERCSNIHNFLPIVFGQPIEDGLDYQTKSFATNLTDLQDISSAQMNGYLAGQRRLVGDRVLYDPLRVKEKDINSRNPAAKIPVRPSAYGKPVQEAVYAFPYHGEPTEAFVSGSQVIAQYANLISGQNPAQLGQFVKGNKTREEYNDTMGHSNARNQSMAMTTEVQVFIPLQQIIKLNILQFMPDTVLFDPITKSNVQINQTDLRKASTHFKMTDGVAPADLQLSGDEFQTVMQVLGSSEAIAAGYNLAPMFSYMMKEKGLDLSPFEKPQLQIMYEQQQAAWQQAAEEAAKKKAEFNTPMPQIPPQLQQYLQQLQQAGGYPPSQASQALEATVGTLAPGTTPTASPPGNIPVPSANNYGSGSVGLGAGGPTGGK